MERIKKIILYMLLSFLLFFSYSLTAYAGHGFFLEDDYIDGTKKIVFTDTLGKTHSSPKDIKEIRYRAGDKFVTVWKCGSEVTYLTNTHKNSYSSGCFTNGSTSFGEFVEYGKSALSPSKGAPVREYYNFDGWAGTDGGAKLALSGTENAPSSPSRADGNDITLYARWLPSEYSISYDLDGGTMPAGYAVSYNIESSSFGLKNPEKSGYVFKGWTGSNGTTPQTSVTIVQGSSGNKSYRANYAVNGISASTISTPFYMTNNYDEDDENETEDQSLFCFICGERFDVRLYDSIRGWGLDNGGGSVVCVDDINKIKAHYINPQLVTTLPYSGGRYHCNSQLGSHNGTVIGGTRAFNDSMDGISDNNLNGGIQIYLGVCRNTYYDEALGKTVIIRDHNVNPSYGYPVLPHLVKHNPSAYPDYVLKEINN
ncbi:MAG: InlB B-repeat-containing protein [Lachnospiraceae bacterium]|nr:InlB B-repeat-containing protein [Lachnospiraceae bacterium]